MNNLQVDSSQHKHILSRKGQIKRLLWTITWAIFARPLPRSFLSGWKRFLLRCFGANIHKKAIVYSTATIYMPQNLEMDEYSYLGPDVDCYNVSKIKIGAYSVISQKSYLCSASHDITNPKRPLISAPIVIEDYAWIAADAFVGMGVKVGQGAVVGARAAVFKDVEPWTVVGGNPAKFIKKREIIN